MAGNFRLFIKTKDNKITNHLFVAAIYNNTTKKYVQIDILIQKNTKNIRDFLGNNGEPMKEHSLVTKQKICIKIINNSKYRNKILK